MAHTDTGTIDGTTLWEAPPASVPRQLGKYEIIAKIGDGGMASVYCARLHADLEGPHRATKDVALKLIHPHLGREQEFIQMFLDEVRLSMAMTHRCIVQTFDAGTVGEQHFMVMELVAGCSLRHLLNVLEQKHEQVPLGIALLVAMEICSALEYAHGFPVSGGVIHRDVSPGNILLSLQGDVKLTDFGVAKAAGRLAVSSANLIKGKLSYMAPEQARGLVDPRSDLFALGAVLYEMICGRSLRGEASLKSVLAGDAPVQLPSRLRPELSPTLERLMMRCLAPRCADRPPNAAALREEFAEEAFQLQSRGGGRRDMHAALRLFLTERVQRQGPPSSTATPPREAARLAQAVLQHVLEVPTNHGELDGPPLRPLRARGNEATSFVEDIATVEGVATAPLPVRADEDTASLVEEEAGAPPSPLSVKGDEASLRVEPAPGPPTAPLRARGAEATMLVEAVQAPWQVGGPQGRQSEWRLWAVSASVLLLISAGVIFWWLRQGSAASQVALLTSAPSSTALVPPRADAALRVQADLAKAQSADAATLAMVFDASHAPALLISRSASPTTLPAARKGRLDVNAVPWAKVYLDGRYLGDTPVQGIAVSPGLHQLRLVNPRWNLSQQRTVRIKAGERLREIINLR